MTPTLVNQLTAIWMMLLVMVGGLWVINYYHVPLGHRLRVLAIGLGMCVATLLLLYNG